MGGAADRATALVQSLLKLKGSRPPNRLARGGTQHYVCASAEHDTPRGRMTLWDGNFVFVDRTVAAGSQN